MTSLNAILARFLDDRPSPKVDCAGCARLAKCCDFQPFVANFLVGAALERGLELWAEDWRYARQPLGLIPAKAFRDGRTEGDPAFACAFYRGGACGIWAQRPGECSIYTCLEERPELSAEVFAFETTLAQMALIELGFAPGRVGRQIDILNEPNEALGHAPGAEMIYRRAWDWVRGLDRDRVAAWLEDI